MPSPAGPVAAMGLRVVGLSKRFGSTVALRDVDLDAPAGTVHALVGGNGSGKSTLIRILAGVHPADSGTIEIGGRPRSATDHDPATAAAMGLRFVHQDLGVFGELSIAENLALGHGYVTRRGGRIDWAVERRRAAELIERFGIHGTPSTPLAALRPADQAMVAIARALQDQESSASGVLVLDEPTASLPRAEVELVVAALRRAAAAGQTILFVGHRLDEVLSLADDVTVLRDGAVVSRRTSAGLAADELVEAMLGRALDIVPAGRPVARTGPPLLSVRDLAAGPLAGVDLDVWPGEIVGVAGLLGSGRSTLLSALFGRLPTATGSVAIGGPDLTCRVAGPLPTSVRAAMRAGIALVPESRVAEGIFADQTVRHNLSSAVVVGYWRRWRLAHADERVDAMRLVGEFDIRPASDAPVAGTLSGGNQQKTVLARWLRRSPRLLLLDEPTQGVDVGARAAIHGHVRAATDGGAAALFVSSDFEELALVCDRVVVITDGLVTHEVEAPHITSEALTSRCYADAGAAVR